MSNRIAVSVVLLCIFSGAVFTQDAPVERNSEAQKAERRAKMIDAVLRDATELRLPENRAFIAAKLGSIIWKEDPERASALFKNAVADLISAQAIAESNKNPNQQNYDLKNSQSLRPAVLNAIAIGDAEFALASLQRSRPTNIQKALAQTTGSAKINSSSSNFGHLAQQEINLEQRLIRMLAEQKPERSIALLKENIKKHLAADTLALLKKVWSKDPAVGNELANEVVDRLISKPFFGPGNQVNYDITNLASAILQEYMRERAPEEKAITFAESGIRSLGAKLVSTYIERGAAIGFIPLEQLEPIAKRFSPGSIEPLRKAAASTRSPGFHVSLQRDEAYTKLLGSNPSAETLIAEAKKFPTETQQSIYTSAANKMSDAGQYDRAVALLTDNLEDETLEHAISSLNWYHAHLLMNRGEFDAAEAMIMQFNESNRISGLCSLAQIVYGKDPDANRSRANGILQRARSFLPDQPETGNEFSQLLQLINAMAGIESSEAFRNFEPLIGQINSIAEAWVVVSGFQGGYVRQGEVLMTNGLNFGIYLEPATFRILGQKDFDRTLKLIDGLQRRDMRILIYTALLEGKI